MAPAQRLPGLQDDLAAAYLRRLGLRAEPPSADGLARLHRAHLERVPFENLDVHLGVPIELDAHGFARKIALRGRGGFCYELNGAFAALLATLGYAVQLVEARVYSPAGPGGAFGHLALAVEIDGSPVLADVGFGRGCFDEPIPFAADAPRADTAGVFVLRAAEEGALDLMRDDERQYRVATRPRGLEEFAPGCRFHQTSPDSAFTRGTICTIRTGQGRATVAGLRLIETTGAGQEERALDRATLGSVLAARFGIVLGEADLDLLARRVASPVAG